MLGNLRILEISDAGTQYCGHLLVELGAEVVVVEPPAGSPVRGMAPFVGGTPTPDAGCWWQAYNRGKKSVVLDLDSREGRRRFRDLLRTADVLVEATAGGWLDERDLGHSALMALNPALIIASISPFGRTGPRALDPASDLTVLAASGTLSTWGDRDRAPVAMIPPQAWLHAGADAAVGVMAAVLERDASGLGQIIDVSAQASMTVVGAGHTLSGIWGDTGFQRSGSGLRFGVLDLKMTYECRDGYMAGGLFFGSAIGPATERLMDLVYELGGCDETTRDKDWIGYTAQLLSGEEPLSELARVQEVVAEFFRKYTKAELHHFSRERSLLFSPVNTPADLLVDEQLAARDYWQRFPVGDTGIEGALPGRFGRSSVYVPPPLRTPLLGEHQAEVEAVAATRQPDASAPDASQEFALPLAGVKILDLTWALAGPMGARMLADLGATVIHIETATRTDPARTAPPFLQATPGPERSGGFANFNAGKYGVTLDLANAQGRELFLELVKWADALLETFTPRVMPELGLDYETLRKVNPSLVMVSSCLHGQTGPEALRAGYGVQGAGQAGFTSFLGWPDRIPSLPGAYTDFTSCRMIALAITTGIYHQRRTGEGQHIDISQIEAAVSFLSPAILDHAANGTEITRSGNRVPGAAPHGVFPCAGDDRWAAVTVMNDDHWRQLCGATGLWGADPRFATVEGRKANEDELEAALASWTASCAPEQVEALLKNAGVPAAKVFNEIELSTEPQLQHRGFFVEVPHPVFGTAWVEGPRILLSRTPASVLRIPTLGGDNFHVFTDLVGLDPVRIADAAAAGAFD